MPNPIALMPDAHALADTSVPARGWVAGARAQVAGEARYRKDRCRSAGMSYGFRLGAALLPSTEPFPVRMLVATLVDPEERRQSDLRSAVRDLTVATRLDDNAATVRARHRILSTECHPEKASLVRQAKLVVGQYDDLRSRLAAQVVVSDSCLVSHAPTSGSFLGITFGSALIATLMPGNRQALVSAGCLILFLLAYLVLQCGWRYGYKQAVWHCAEVGATRAQDDAALTLTANTEAAARRSRRPRVKLSNPPKGEGYVYVIEFSTGTVKVGQTVNPKQRIQTHLGEAAVFGAYIADFWISPAHMNYLDNETRLINACQRVSHRSRLEYFHAVGYERAVQFANDLTYFSANTDQTSVEGVWA